MVTNRSTPSLERESALWAKGLTSVAGLDEAGRGSLAGPVVAAAVIVPPGTPLDGVWARVQDSKLLTPAYRETLEMEIGSAAAACAVGAASAAEIDRFGIARATRTAMARALRGLSSSPQHLLIDWVQLPEIGIEQTCWAKADQASVSVAAASILAKVWRDRLMTALGAEFPAYGFERHKGYGTAQHRQAIAQIGPCREHRYSFAPVAHYLKWSSVADS